MSFLRTAVAFLRRDLLVQASYRLNLLFGLGAVLATLLFLTYVSDFVGPLAEKRLEGYGGSYFAFLVLGLGVQSFLAAALQQTGRRLREAQMLGTLEALLATRAGVPTILVCLPLSGYLQTSLRVLAYLLLGALVFDMPLHLGNWPAALLVFLLTLLAFGSLGLVFAGLTIAFHRAETLSFFVSTLALFLGGVYYPLEVLPEWLRGPAHLLPITPALKALRVALLAPDAGWERILPQVAILVGFVLLVLPLAFLAFRASLRRAMRDGTLTQY